MEGFYSSGTETSPLSLIDKRLTTYQDSCKFFKISTADAFRLARRERTEDRVFVLKNDRPERSVIAVELRNLEPAII